MSSQDLGSDANISEENKTDDEKLTEAGLAVAVVGVVTDIITDDMKHDMAGRLALLNIREGVNAKKTFSFGHCPNPPPPPPLTPIRATWSFFSDVKIQDLKVT